MENRIDTNEYNEAQLFVKYTHINIQLIQNRNQKGTISLAASSKIRVNQRKDLADGDDVGC